MARKEPKRFTCAIPYTSFETDAVEAWMEDYAAEGWVFEDFDASRAAKLYRREPVQLRFALTLVWARPIFAMQSAWRPSKRLAGSAVASGRAIPFIAMQT